MLQANTFPSGFLPYLWFFVWLCQISDVFPLYWESIFSYCDHHICTFICFPLLWWYIDSVWRLLDCWLNHLCYYESPWVSSAEHWNLISETVTAGLVLWKPNLFHWCRWFQPALLFRRVCVCFPSLFHLLCQYMEYRMNHCVTIQLSQSDKVSGTNRSDLFLVLEGTHFGLLCSPEWWLIILAAATQ